MRTLTTLSRARNPKPYAALMYGVNTASQFRETIEHFELNQVRYVVSNCSFREWPASELILEPYLMGEVLERKNPQGPGGGPSLEVRRK